jgi:hypothetical protein
VTEQPQPPPQPAHEIFAEIIANLIVFVWGRNPHLKPVPLSMEMRGLIHNRIACYARQFAAIAARWRAGTLRRLPRRVPRDPDAPAPPIADPPAKPRAKHPLPRGRGWLGQLLSWQGAGFGSQLHHLVTTNPEMRELLAAAPQLTRVLGPLLRALGHPPAPGVLPPLPRRPSRAKPPRAAGENPPREKRPRKPRMSGEDRVKLYQPGRHELGEKRPGPRSLLVRAGLYELPVGRPEKTA